MTYEELERLLEAHIGVVAGPPARVVEPSGDAVRRYPLRAAATLVALGARRV
jgi:hypothetical protein